MKIVYNAQGARVSKRSRRKYLKITKYKGDKIVFEVKFEQCGSYITDGHNARMRFFVAISGPLGLQLHPGIYCFFGKLGRYSAITEAPNTVGVSINTSNFIESRCVGSVVLGGEKRTG